MAGYRTVATAAEAELIVRKSRFIGQVQPVEDEGAALAFVEAVRKKHPQAAHNCHAYIVDQAHMRSSDDGEPSGTAGRPMLELLRREQLERVAVVVTRYFGGILLGTGGLARAYSQAAKMALDAAGTGRMVMHRRLDLTVDYAVYGRLDNYLREQQLPVLETQFSHRVRVAVGIPDEDVEDVRARLTDLCHGQLKVCLGEEYHKFVRGK